MLAQTTQQDVAPGAARKLRDTLDRVASDPDLQTLIDAWPRLPETIRAGILAIVAVVEPCEST